MGVSGTAIAAWASAGAAVAGVAQADDNARRQKHGAERQAELIQEEAKKTQAEAAQAAQAAQDQIAQQQARDAAAELQRQQEASKANAQVVVDVGAPGAGETTAKRRARFQIADTPETSVRI
jgi:membrane-bound lytic murein transglycosylase